MAEMAEMAEKKMKIGDLVRPGQSDRPHHVGLVIGESFSSYSGALLQVPWPNKAGPMWEPKQYLEKVHESR